MDTIQLTEIFRDAILTGFKVATPILLVSILVGLFISIIQAATSINEQTMTFVPKLIIVDEKGNHVETTNRTKHPVFERFKKAELLGYDLYERDMPLTNPATIADKLEAAFVKSEFAHK